MKRYKLRLANKVATGLLCTVIFVPLLSSAQSLEQAVAYSLDTNPEIRVAYTQFKVFELGELAMSILIVLLREVPEV
jgi:adhesin transport system outer membrane protein